MRKLVSHEHPLGLRSLVLEATVLTQNKSARERPGNTTSEPWLGVSSAFDFPDSRAPSDGETECCQGGSRTKTCQQETVATASL